MSSTRELAEAVSGVSFDALDEPEIEAVRRLLLDHLGVAAAGSVTDSATTFRRTMDRFAHDASAALPVIGADVTAAPVPAAMANAVAGHSIEYDDVHNSSSSHPGVVMYPAAMAATALAGGDERDLVRAVVIGFEVMCRAGRAADPAAHYARHFHPTGTIGSLGAAAAAAAAAFGPRRRRDQLRHRDSGHDGLGQHGVPSRRRLDQAPPPGAGRPQRSGGRAARGRRLCRHRRRHLR